MTDSSKNTGMDLIGGAEPVKQAVAAYEQGSVPQNLRILIEQRYNLRRRYEFCNADRIRQNKSKPDGDPNTLLDPLHITGTGILPGEGSHAQRNALKREDDKGIHASVCAPARSTGISEAVDIALHEHIRKRNDRHLHAGGKTDPDDFPEGTPVNPHLPVGNSIVLRASG